MPGLIPEEIENHNDETQIDNALIEIIIKTP